MTLPQLLILCATFGLISYTATIVTRIWESVRKVTVDHRYRCRRCSTLFYRDAAGHHIGLEHADVTDGKRAGRAMNTPIITCPACNRIDMIVPE